MSHFRQVIPPPGNIYTMQTTQFRMQYTSAAAFILVAVFSYLTEYCIFAGIWGCFAATALLYVPTFDDKGRLTIRPDSLRNTAALVFLGIALAVFGGQLLWDGYRQLNNYLLN